MMGDHIKHRCDHEIGGGAQLGELGWRLLMKNQDKIASRIEEEREYFLERLKSQDAMDAFKEFTNSRSMPDGIKLDILHF